MYLAWLINTLFGTFTKAVPSTFNITELIIAYHILIKRIDMKIIDG
jgi:hypothetical protein